MVGIPTIDSDDWGMIYYCYTHMIGSVQKTYFFSQNRLSTGGLLSGPGTFSASYTPIHARHAHVLGNCSIVLQP